LSSELEIRAYRPGDEKQILTLFRQSFGRDLDAQAWAWRFRDNPAGPGVIDLSWDGDILAAHYAVSPVTMRINGQDWLTGLSGTTMTHPHYRGQGLFPKLARSVYALMAQAGMGMVWGLPNALSHRGFIRDLEWVDIYEVPTLRLTLANHRPLPAPHSVVALPEFDEHFDQLWEQVKDNYRIIVRRDRSHLQWRYVKNPTEVYRILAYVDANNVAGYVVFKRYCEELQIVDILTRSGTDIGITLISQVAQIALEQSLSAVSLWLNVSHPLHWALEKLGFRNGEPVAYLGGFLLQPDLQEAGIYDFHNWYLTMGDSDVF
jgi:GNAT superfamily N-acetyltransferase